MKIAGIICEYNPLHLGHKKQIDYLRAQGYAVVCLMCGNFVQRGAPAIFDKMHRAEAAVRCGADLVLELPVQYALSSAEGFAAGGVAILSRLCDTLCFGAENAAADALLHTAKTLLHSSFPDALRSHLDQGLSFPAARAAALEALGADRNLVERPNNILAVEYCKAILAQKCDMHILPIVRDGSYHDLTADAQNPSASSLRVLIQNGEPWEKYTPAPVYSVLKNAQVHATASGERAILARLRTMTDADFESLPFGSEGLWRKLMHASREQSTLEDIITATKSKRYTRTRIDRMIMCAFLGLTAGDMAAPAPYCRVLTFNDTGRAILSDRKSSGFFVNIGTDTHHDYQCMEARCTSLYGLFAPQPEAPDAEASYRVQYLKEASPYRPPNTQE